MDGVLSGGASGGEDHEDERQDDHRSAVSRELNHPGALVVLALNHWLVLELVVLHAPCGDVGLGLLDELSICGVELEAGLVTKEDELLSSARERDVEASCVGEEVSGALGLDQRDQDNIALTALKALHGVYIDLFSEFA